MANGASVTLNIEGGTMSLREGSVASDLDYGH